jgi:polysaccharide export outer membrane protein
VTTVLRHVSRSVLVFALVLLAGCSSITNMTDRLVGSSDPNAQTYSNSTQQALTVPPNMNERPLPAPSRSAATNKPPVSPRPMAAQIAAAQAANSTPVQPPAAETPMAPSPNLQTASINPGAPTTTIDPNSNTYLIGPGDNLDIFVWQNPQLSVKVPVRPDGKISVPLIQDVNAVGRTPEALAREITQKLKAYVKDPNVTVIVSSFVGPFSQQIRVIGEAAKPQALAYRSNMTLLDVMIEVGGLTRYAAGNRAVIVRNVDGHHETIHARVASLIDDGDVKDNVAMRPGDILIIPQRYF